VFDDERTNRRRCRPESLMTERHPGRPAPWTLVYALITPAHKANADGNIAAV